MELLQWVKETKEIILFVDVVEENLIIQIRKDVHIVDLERVQKLGDIPGRINPKENGRFKGGC